MEIEAPSKSDWQKRCFESGTIIVTRDDPRAPHFYVHGHGRAGNEARHGVADDLCAYANGGPRPVWADNAHRDSETRVTHEDGFAITATGPMVDRSPPALDWVEDDSRHAHDARARLIDWLAGTRKEAPDAG